MGGAGVDFSCKFHRKTSSSSKKSSSADEISADEMSADAMQSADCSLRILVLPESKQTTDFMKSKQTADFIKCTLVNVFVQVIFGYFALMVERIGGVIR